MQEIKRRLDVMQILHDKNNRLKQSKLKIVADKREVLESLKLKKNQSLANLKNCNQRITKQYESMIDVESIKSLNKFAEKLEQECQELDIQCQEAKNQLDEAISSLNKTLKKGEAFQKIIDDTSQEHSRLYEKSLEKNVEDIWMSRQGAKI